MKDKVVDYILNLGLDVLKDKVVDVKEQKELKKQLQDFIKRQSKINEVCLLAEEIDFQGWSNYIIGDLLDDMRMCMFGKKEERAMARKMILDKSIGYSLAEDENAKKKIIKFTSDVLEILKTFYRKRSPKTDLLLAGEMVDDVKAEVEKLSSVITETIGSQNIMSIDKNMQHIKSGEIDKTEENLNLFINSMKGTHALYPHYGFVPEYIDGEMRYLSKPLTANAIETYPPKMKCKGTIRVGNKIMSQFSEDTLEYAKRHQLSITISVKEAIKYLGNIADPIQREAKELTGSDLIIPPEPFPEAFPCSISMNQKVIFDYILLRTNEVLDDDTFVVSNSEQGNCPFRVNMKVNILKNETSFSIKTENATNKDILQYVRFMKLATEKHKMEIRVLTIGENIMEGCFDSFVYQSDFLTIDEEIEFWEKIVAIEGYLGISIKIPDEMDEDDRGAVDYIYELINGEEYEGEWTETVFSFTLNEQFRKKIADMKEEAYSVSFVGDISVPLFEERYHFNIRRRYEKVKVDCLKKLKDKAEILDIGDSIKIRYVPATKEGGGIFIDTLHIESSEA